jgi:hypothetical protein
MRQPNACNFTDRRHRSFNFGWHGDAMTIALRKQLRQQSLPEISFGPFRFLQALPWLILAAAMRVVAYGGVVAQRSIELADGTTSLGELDLGEQRRLSIAVLWRIALLMIAASLSLSAAGYSSFAPHMMGGIDGMAFDQFTGPGKFWSATVAALVLLMIIGAERNRGRVNFFAAVGEFAQRGLWIGAAVVVLGVVYLGLGVGQGWVRDAIWNFWQTSPSSQFIKNLIFFVFIFSFAMLRLWLTLLILTFGLKQSYIRAA